MKIEASNSDRLAKLVHYVIARTKPDQLGATKLNKILWFIDCAAFKEFGHSISGLHSYTKRQFGPTPYAMPVVLKEVKSEGLISEEVQEYTIGFRREYHSLVEPDFDVFSKSEIDLINRVIVDHISMTANEISELSHDALWEETELEEPMTIAEGAFAPRPVSTDAIEWAKSEVARLKL